MNTYPHMCRMDHTEIGHADSGDDERCPLCQVMAERDQLRADMADARKDARCAREEFDNLKRCADEREKVYAKIMEALSAAEEERDEQARINGIGSEREARLMAERDDLRRQLSKTAVDALTIDGEAMELSRKLAIAVKALGDIADDACWDAPGGRQGRALRALAEIGEGK